MKKQFLTPEQAFRAMSIFLTRYYDRTGGDELGSVLGDILPGPSGGRSGDPAAWGDWLDAIEEMRKTPVPERTGTGERR